MGSRHVYQQYFETHPGVYFRSPGWLEYQKPGQLLGPAHASSAQTLGERRSREELIAQYGEENGLYLFEQFSAYRQHYSGLTYISTGVETEATLRARARAEAEWSGWKFEEVQGSVSLLQRLVNGQWDAADFLVVSPGKTVRGTLGDSIVEAE
jgi:hypothetical protein